MAATVTSGRPWGWLLGAWLLWAAVLGVNQGPRLAGPPTVVSGLWRPAHQAL